MRVPITGTDGTTPLGSIEFCRSVAAQIEGVASVGGMAPFPLVLHPVFAVTGGKFVLQSMSLCAAPAAATERHGTLRVGADLIRDKLQAATATVDSLGREVLCRNAKQEAAYNAALECLALHLGAKE